MLPWSLGLTSVSGPQAKGSSGPSGDDSRTTSILHQRVQDLEDENQSLNTRSWMLQKLLDAHVHAAASPGAEQVAPSLDPVLSLSAAPRVCSLLLTCRVTQGASLQAAAAPPHSEARGADRQEGLRDRVQPDTPPEILQLPEAFQSLYTTHVQELSALSANPDATSQQWFLSYKVWLALRMLGSPLCLLLLLLLLLLQPQESVAPAQPEPHPSGVWSVARKASQTQHQAWSTNPKLTAC